MEKLEQLQKKECFRRMKVLGLSDFVVNDFMDKKEVYMSVYLNNILDAVIQKPSNDILKAVKEFEKEYGGIVYHIQSVNTDVGELLTFFYVSAHQEEWDTDLIPETQDNGQNYIFTYAYVKNLTIPEYSEFGGVGVIPSSGGVRRIY